MGDLGEQEKPISGHALAKILRGFSVFPAGDIRIGEKVAKGYRREAFTEAWNRYIPPRSRRSGFRNATPQQLQ